MSVRGGKRPPDSGLRRRPRGDRAADQMALNGGLLRAENSDALYKVIATEEVSARTGRELTWGLALSELEEIPFEERRVILTRATLLWCACVLWLAFHHVGPGDRFWSGAVDAVGKRLAVLEGRRRRGVSG